MPRRPPGATEPPRRDALLRRGLRFSQLRLLAALAETGRISAAAAQLGITQPAASRLLAELQKAAGAPLYVRHPRGVTLTEAGGLLAARAEIVLRQLDQGFDEIQETTRGARGLVRIGAVTGPALEIVLPVIRELRVTYPEIEVSVQVDTSDKLAEQLLRLELDFYIGRLPDELDARAVSLRPIGPEPVSLVVRLEHPLTRLERVRIEDCLIYDWVMQPPGGLQRRTVESWLLARGLPQPKRVLGTSSILLTLALVSDTNAVAPLSRAVAEFFASRSGLSGNIRRLDVAEDIAVTPFSLILRADEPPPPPVARVLSLIETQIRRL
ncbi:LysR family transcriptional regulator [Albimonas sp. CAU 1670]|uniref:LysR family transcriptional regulator n=1 Tax=Albimonas sp. CAU 1670 TaxID=3032599 RepID=UPI0023DA7A03|nr:LysR family transcriptional regulator [Albimonas sp. CAU 1670]MDF2234801.1 LysR family transcriptional regulator [Albimonas sp. CAU 1670]